VKGKGKEKKKRKESKKELVFLPSPQHKNEREEVGERVV